MRNNGVQFLLCLLLSSAIWLIHNLSGSYVGLVSVPVQAKSNIEAHSEMSTTDATVTAQLRASGFRHIMFALKHKRPLVVTFSPSDLKYLGEDKYSIPSSRLYKYSTAIFGHGVAVESFILEGLSFTFPSVSFKKVPVVNVGYLDFRSQYMALSPMSLQPDSVYVYGEPLRLDNVDRVLTKPLEIYDINTDLHGSVKLEVPKALRLSHESVTYSLAVSRYVEVKKEMRIEVKNVPSGVTMSVLPSTADVVLKCVFPLSVDPCLNASLYVDYKDFANSITGRCVVKASGMSSAVINYTTEPEVVDCLIN